MKYRKVSQRFKQLLDENNITAQELSNMTNVGKASISHYVNGTHCPSQETASKIADPFQINPAWLMGFDVLKAKLDTDFDMNTPKYRINKPRLRMRLTVRKISIDDMASSTEIPIERIRDILSGEAPFVSEKELRDISAFLETDASWLLIDPSEPANALYSDIMKELNSIKSSLKANIADTEFTDEEIEMINAYRDGDEITQAMVRRTLGID